MDAVCFGLKMTSGIVVVLEVNSKTQIKLFIFTREDLRCSFFKNKMSFSYPGRLPDFKNWQECSAGVFPEEFIFNNQDWEG